MNRKKYFLILLSAWFLMIGSYTAFKEYSLHFGKEVMLRVVPVDPRDLFRGDYVILSYGISVISADQRVFYSYGDTYQDSVYTGNTLYITLIKDGDYYKGGNIYKTKPEEGLFIKGTAESGRRSYSDDEINNTGVRISYGIENFFVPEGEGKAIESERNQNKVAVKAVINSYGNASIKELYINGKKVDFKNKNEKTY